MKVLKSFFLKKSVWFVAVALSFIFVYQNCGPVKFSTGSTSDINLPQGGPGGGGSNCAPSIAVTPQISFVPSSYDAGQQFQIIIANQNLYGTISINFGDGTPALVVNPSSSAPLVHTYAFQGSYKITITATDSACNQSLNSTQSSMVGPCVPEAATLQSAVIPMVPTTPPPVAPLTLTATVGNSTEFTSVGWYLNGGTSPQAGGADATLVLQGGNYTLQPIAVDTCGSTRPGPVTTFCVAQSGNPATSVIPTSFTAGTANTFTVANPGNYQSLSINFGDGTTSTISTTGAGAGVITHTYQTAGSFTYTVTALDSCGSSRTTSTPVTVSPAACTTTQPDGCSGSQYCTGRTTCNPTGNCQSSCGKCDYAGTPVTPVTSCSGTQSCVAGGTSCLPTNVCTSTCGQCGYSGTPVTPVMSCSNGQACTTGGTTCAPTKTCVTIPGQCGAAPPAPTPTPTPVGGSGGGSNPTPTPTPTPVATSSPQPACTPITNCLLYAQSQGYTGGTCPQGTLGGFNSQKCTASPLNGDDIGPALGCPSGCCGLGHLTTKPTTVFCPYNPNACIPDGIFRGEWHGACDEGGQTNPAFDDRAGTCCSGKSHVNVETVMNCTVNYEYCGP